MEPITLIEARKAIETILAGLPDSALPLPDRIEEDERGKGPIAWFGGHGYHLTSATRGADRTPNPEGYRSSASWDALVGEACTRMSAKAYADKAATR